MLKTCLINLVPLLAGLCLAGCDIEITGRTPPPDYDGDAVPDVIDNCPEVANSAQQDNDADDLGDPCDPDDDNDGMPDEWEAFYDFDPLRAADAEEDPDADGLSNRGEYLLGSHPRVGDMEQDGVVDGRDNCPFDANPDQTDTDGDGQGDACDADIDGDGFSNREELFNGSDPANGDEVYGTPSLVRVSLMPGGAPANGYSRLPRVSDDGRYVVYASAASNLVDDDANGQVDIFRSDVSSQTTIRISENGSGVGGNDGSWNPRMSSDASVIAFNSRSDNLVEADDNQLQDVFVWREAEGALARANTDASGVVAGQEDSFVSAVARDGSAVFFNTNDGELHPDVRHRRYMLLEKGLVSGALEPVLSTINVALGGQGRYLVFETAQSDLIPSDDNKARDIFLIDRSFDDPLDGLERISLSPGGHESDGDAFRPDMTPDARFVVFDAEAGNLVDDDQNGVGDVFLHDRDSGRTERISLAWNGEEGNGDSYGATVSDDGRFVAFVSEADNLVLNDFNDVADVFLYDRLIDRLRRISTSLAGAQGNAASGEARISGDGNCVVFVSASRNLDELPDNGQRDIYRYCRTGS